MVAAAIVGSAVVGGVAANSAASKGAKAVNKATDAAESAAQREAAIGERAQDLAEKQYADQKLLTDQYSPLYRDLINKSIEQQDKSIAQSDAQWASYQQNFAPLEKKLADTALNYDTPERRAAAAAEASGAVADQFASARDQRNSDMAASGLMPGSGASLALDNASRIEEAKAKAGAATDARRTVESMGLSYLDNAARFGRNMPSTGIQTAAQGQAASSQTQGTVQGLQGLTAAPAASAQPLLQTAIGANSASGQLALSAGQLGLQSSQYQTNQLLGGIGAGLQTYGMYKSGAFASSEHLKDMGEEVDGDAALELAEGSPSRGWKYKPGLGDGSTQQRIGPTAQSLAGTEVSDGNVIDGISMLGLHHAGLGAASKRLKRIEQKLGLDSHGSKRPGKKGLGLDSAEDVEYTEVV